MLNDDGEIVEETETHAERHARTVVAAQVIQILEERNHCV